ncbi:MAG: TIR domain-containing protein [Steroidobacteraceae bacterium]
MAEGDGEEWAAGAAGATRAVFISCASQDAAVATTVVEALERSGVACWIAPRDVTPGAFYADEIVHAIDAAKAAVLILSRNAADSQHVLREVERAASKRHPVVSLRVDQAPLPAGLEYFLNTSQWLDASGVDIARSMPKLIAAVRAAIQAPVVTPDAAPTPRAPAPSPSARPPRRTAIIVASLIGLAIAGFAVDRLWVSSRRAAPTSVPTSAVPASALAPATPTIPEKSVAVLPFVNMSEDKSNEYFSDGLSEELIDMLTKIPDLRVPARTSSFYFKGKQSTVADIAKALSVTHVLEGSVRKAGNKLRITAQLVRVDTGYHLWSETYDRELDDIFKVQDEIAGAVVKALKVSLLETEVPRATPANSEAYTLYLQARAIFTNAPQLADDQRAIDCLQRALKLDPKFARAWAALASYRVTDYLYYGSGNYQHVLAEARYAAEQSLKLDPKLSDAHVAMAEILSDIDWNWRAAEIEVNQALALDPGDADAIKKASHIALTLGRFDEALRLAQNAAALDPLGAWKYGAIGNAHKASGRLIEAEAAYRQALDVAPTMSQLHLMVGWVLVARGEPTATLAEMEQETDDTYRQVGRAMALDALGRKDEADRALAVAEAKYAREAGFPIAIVYANRSDLDRAFAWPERAYQQHDDWLQWIPGEPLLKNLKGDLRYKAFLRKMNLPVRDDVAD